MKKLAATAVLGLAAFAAATGCQSNSKQAAGKPPLRPAVTDIAPTPPSTYIAPQPVQPVTAVAPVTVAAAEPAAAPAAATSGGSYTVQKGDTLYKIARERYGNGNQWQRIAAANPGVSPSTLKVGQKIVVP